MRLYVRNPPGWWPYALVLYTDVGELLTAHHVIVDNGAYGFYKRGSFPSDVRKWFMDVCRKGYRYARLGIDTIVVVPDYPMNPWVSYEWARTCLGMPVARSPPFRLALVFHVERPEPSSIRESLRLYSRLLDRVDVLAVPARLTCGRDRDRMLHFVHRVADIAEEHGLSLHILGASLSPEFLRRVQDRVESIDTMNWTRAMSAGFARAVGRKVMRNDRDRSIWLASWIYYLHTRGVEIDDYELALPHVPERIRAVL